MQWNTEIQFWDGFGSFSCFECIDPSDKLQIIFFWTIIWILLHSALNPSNTCLNRPSSTDSISATRNSHRNSRISWQRSRSESFISDRIREVRQSYGTSRGRQSDALLPKIHLHHHIHCIVKKLFYRLAPMVGIELPFHEKSIFFKTVKTCV